MPLTETALTAIVQKAFNYALDQGQNKVVGWAQDKLGLERRQQAFKRALSKAYKKFEKQYPQWTADLFDASFLEHEGAFVLAQFLVQDGHPDPSELALRWADSRNTHDPERRTTLVRELEPPATDFLQYMTSALKAEPELSDLNDSRAFEQLASDLKAIRRKLDAEQTTPGTRWDYLHWLIERNLYLDPRGTFQTQRQVLVKLDEVYISLRAQRDTTPGEVDRRLLEQELAQLETQMARATLAAEEVEDQREQLLARIQNRLDSTRLPGEVIELAEAVNRHHRLVIVGDPGSGKSTLLRYLALKHAQALYAGRSEAGSDLGPVRFPILIRIADYAEHGLRQSLGSYLADYYALHGYPKFGLADLLATELAEGNCLVLLDGLHEIVNVDDRRKVVERIEDFIRYHGNRPNRFVITSRIAGYRSAPLSELFVHYTVQEMDEAQIRRFLERWCTAVEAAQAPDLSQGARDAVARREIDAIMKAVQTSPGVRHVATNPLLLRTLALIHRTSAQLPQKRIELYKLAADTLARTWRTAQGVPESALVDDRYLTRLLSRLAYWLHANKPTGIATEREVYAVLGAEWAQMQRLSWDEDDLDMKIEKEIRKFLQTVREHTGLFVERGPGLYGFMQLVFEEYYAARYLVARSRSRAELIRKHLHDPRWDEPILLALSFVGLDSPEDAAELLETAILAQGEEAKELGFSLSRDEDILGRDYLFALRCLADNIPVNSRLMRQLMSRLANEVLYWTGPAQLQPYRQLLWERLEYLKGSRASSMLALLLVGALSNDDPDIRYRAAESLGRVGYVCTEVVTALLTALSDDNLKVGFVVAESLGRLGQESREVVEALLTRLHDKDFKVRYRAAESLGQIKVASGEVVTALRSVLPTADIEVRRVAEETLKRLGYHYERYRPQKQNLDKIFSLWDDLETSDFAQMVEDFTNLLAEICHLPIVSSTSSTGDWFLSVIDVADLFSEVDLILRSSHLALAFRRQNTLTQRDLDQIRGFISKHIGLNCKTIVLVMPEDSAIEMTSTLLTSRIHGYSFVIRTRSQVRQLLNTRDLRSSLRSLLLAHIDLSKISPYQISGPTSDNIFFGRDRELSDIEDRISNTSFTLIGGRRIGKSSILQQLHRVRLKEKFYPLLFSCQKVVEKESMQEPTKIDFLAKVTSTWFSNKMPGDATSFADIVSWLPQDKPLVFLVDEADMLTPADRRAGWPLFREMRALAEGGLCQFVFAGEYKLNEAMNIPGSPFHNFTVKKLIGRLDKPVVKELVTLPMSRQLEIPLVNEEAIVDRIYEFTAGHPNIVQRLCDKLISLISEQQNRQITLNDVEAVIADPVFLNDFLATFWERATVLEHIISLIMTQRGERFYTLHKIRQILNDYDQLKKKPKAREVEQALQRLTELRNILKKERDGYTFDVRAFPVVIAKSITVEDQLEVLFEDYAESGDIEPMCEDSQGEERVQ